MRPPAFTPRKLVAPSLDDLLCREEQGLRDREAFPTGFGSATYPAARRGGRRGEGEEAEEDEEDAGPADGHGVLREQSPYGVGGRDGAI